MLEIEKTKSSDYEGYFDSILQNLSEKERALLEWPKRLRDPEDVVNTENFLLENNFVKCEAGKIQMGVEQGLKCSIEGTRKNETPVREITIPPFYISKTTVTNLEYELFDKRHSRTHTSLGDKNPVTCITYGRAVSYALWLNEQTGLSFSLPTEPQWVSAMAPPGWMYPYKEFGLPQRRSQNHYKAFPKIYPEGELGATIEVDDTNVPTNYLGIHHPTGNVSIFSFGHFSTEGHWGSATDGSYAIVLGGNFRLCPLGSRVVTRGIIDVTGIADNIGIRLVHPDPGYLWENINQ